MAQILLLFSGWFTVFHFEDTIHRRWAFPVLDNPQGWQVVHISDDSPEFDALKKSLLSGNPGVGKQWDTLALQRAWCIHNPTLWKLYLDARQYVKGRLDIDKLDKTELKLRQGTADTLGPDCTTLPDPLFSGGGVNEVRLFHETKPDALLEILDKGLNERLSGTRGGNKFGDGVYFAEDAGKADMYASGHVPGTLPDLEAHLYSADSALPGEVCYMLVCRVVCGHYAVTEDGHRVQGTESTLWATSARRDLAKSSAGDQYTSLLVEIGPYSKYREFVQFHGQRTYPEYLLAYSRA
eukprot:TRINITY_DN1738_c1_g1_i5.p1 TRINITY_DN1738_c1_g1~~TRINITY_DN1738_c1_g1_i5.p1  ORF type:complete len:295 (+),score=54.17 TRINITY_DN1738_c1_g1_i5:640-1524(+)